MWEWIKEHASSLLGFVLVLFGAGWVWQRRKRLSAEAQLEVERLRNRNVVQKHVRKKLLEDAQDHSEAIRAIDAQIEANERAILNHHNESLEGLTRDEIKERLRRLGY